MNPRTLLRCLMLVSALSVTSAFAATKTFTGTGDFDDAGNWDGGTLPVMGDDLIISGTCTFNLTGITTPTSATTFGSLQLDEGILLFSVVSPNSLKITNFTSTMSMFNVLDLGAGRLDVSGTFSAIPLLDFNFFPSTGEIVYNGAGSQSIAALPYYDLTITGTRSDPSTITFDPGPYQISNFLTLSATGTNLTWVTTGTSISLGAGTAPSPANFDYFNLNVSPAVTFSGTYQIGGDLFGPAMDTDGSTIVFNGTSNQLIVDFDFDNLTILDRSASTIAFDGTNRVKGTFTDSTTMVTFDFALNPMAPSTFEYNGTGTQTVRPLPYANLTLSGNRGGNPITFAAGTVGISGDFTVNSTNTSYGTGSTTFDFNGTDSQTIDGIPYENITISGNKNMGTLTFNDTVGIAGTATLSATNATYVLTGTTFDYNGSGAQTILALPYDNLAISNGRVATPAITFSAGTTSISGSFIVSATGGPTYVATGTTIEFNGTSTTQTIPGEIPYNILTLSGAAQKEVGIASVTANTLNINGTTLIVQPSLNMTAAVLSGDAGASISFVDNTAGLAINGPANSAYMGNFQGAGAISKGGAGTLALSTPSTIYTGAVMLTEGTLEINNGSALGNAGSAGILTMMGTPTLVINNSSLSNEINVSSGSPIVRCGATSAAKISSLSGPSLALQTTGPGDLFTVLLQSSSPGCTTAFAGPGNLILADNPTMATHYDGNLDISAGFVRLDSVTSLGKTTSTTVVGATARLASNTSTAIPQAITLNGGSLQVTGGDDRKYAGNIFLTAASSINLNDAASGMQARSIEIATLNRGGQVLSVSGPGQVGNPPFPPPPVLKITGAQTGGGSMTIAQNAEVELSGTGNLSSTVVNVNAGGILTASNTVVNSMVAVNLSAGGVLRGTGEFSGASSVSSTGGLLLPGPVMGTGILPLTAPTTLTLDSTSQVVFRAGAPGTNDRINVGGNLTLDGLLNVAPLAGFGVGTYTLFQHGGLTNNTIDLPPAPPGLSFALDTTTVSNEVRLIVSALPITIDSPGSITALKGSDVDYTLAATGPSAPPIQFSTTALPPGLRVENGKIVGKPTLPGSYTFTITATNGVTTSTLLVSVTISEVNNVTFASFSAEGKVGSPFYVDLADQVGDLSGVTFTAAAPLPEGLRLSGSVISGTPKVAGQSVITIDATKTGFTSGNGTLTLTILAKTETVGVQLSDLLADPEEPGINEPVIFFVNAFSPENLVTTISWDLGDGSTATGEIVDKTYTSAGTYTVTVTATAGGKTTMQTLQIVVSSIDPNAPVIDNVVISPAPSTTGQAVSFIVSASDINGDALTYEWNFGDGSAPVSGSVVSYTYNTAGEYLVTVKATDATNLTSRTVERTHFVSTGGGVPNLQFNANIVSFDGVGQTITFSSDGLIGLSIDVASLTRELLETKTDFGLTNFRNVPGDSPTVKVQTSGLRVAKTTVREKATRKERGKARKTLAVSAREVGEPAKVETEPEDKGVSKLKMKGDFFPARGGVTGALSRAAKADVAKADKLTASGSITMPGGLDMTNGTEVEVALGNIIDKVAIDAKGKGKGQFTTLQMRIKTDKTTKKTVGDVTAKFSIKMNVADMIADGFDTEGVVVSKEQNGKPLSIQAALMIGGVVYTADNPVTLKVSPKEDKAQMISRSGAAN